MNFKIKVGLLVAVLALTVGLLVAVTAVPQGAEKVYRMGIHEDMTTTNYLNYMGPGSTVWNAYVLGNMHPGLYSLADVTFKLIPGLAADYATPIVKEGNFYTSSICIKKGVQWSDGTEITAEDVAFSYNGIMSLDPIAMGGNWPYNVDPDLFDHMDKTSNYCVKFYLKDKPGLARWQYGLLAAPILNKTFWGPKFEAALASADKVASIMAESGEGEPSGSSFVFKTWEPGAYAENVPNPHYFYKGVHVTEYDTGGYSESKPGYQFSTGDTSGNVTLDFEVGPYVDSVIYKLYGTLSAGALALIAGDIDFQLNPLGYELGLRHQLEQAKGVQIVQNPDNGIFYVSFNLRRPPMNNLYFRKALDCMLDREYVTNQLLQGVAIAAYSVVPAGNAFWFREPSAEEAQARCIGFSAADKLNQAVAYLKQGGFTWQEEPAVNADGTIKAGKGIMLNGELVKEIELIHPNAAYDNRRNIFGLQVAKVANTLGIPMRDVPTGFNVIVSRVFDEQDFDMWSLGWSLTIFPDYLEGFFASKYAGLGGDNPEGYSNADYDELAEEFVREQDLNKAQAEAFAMQAFLADELPYMPLFYSPLYEAYRSDFVTYPYTQVLAGMSNNNGFPAYVQLVK